MNLFDTVFLLVVGEEGGYVFDPHDPGGETKYGISHRAYPLLDIANLTLSDAKDIYGRDYWLKNRCADMPWRWGLSVFDCSINQGSAVALAQTALKLAVDGIAGRETLAAMVAAPDEDFDDYIALRAQRYAAARDYSLYGRGWLKRLVRITRASEHPPT
jgi:lysozyme family protein